MNCRRHFYNILNGTSQSPGFWHGQPHEDAKDNLFSYFGVKNNLELGLTLGSTMHWIWPEEAKIYKHPKQTVMFDVLNGKPRTSLSEDGVFADCETVEEVESFPWPDLEYLDFTSCLEEINQAHEMGLAVMSGMWCPFFHVVADFFGMENYFVKMYTHPEVVQAVTQKVVDFYLAANNAFFDLTAGKVDLFFFGNDFGCQLDMLVSPESFQQYILPSMKRLVAQAKARSLPVALHSCGSITKAIPFLVDLDIDVLHPIQAKAAGMDASNLHSKWGEKLIFMGGMDAQDILPFGTPDQIRAEAKRLTDIFGPNYILSPSHECLLPNIPPENIEAMSDFIKHYKS